LEYNQFESLIKNESIIKAQERWFKDPNSSYQELVWTIKLKHLSEIIWV
jgi:hypothetical protein